MTTETERAAALAEFKTLPGVGPRIAADFWRLGLRHVSDLAAWEPDELFRLHNLLRDKPDSRAMLYIMRCAVYVARTPAADREPEKLRCWYWRDISPD